MAEKRASWVRRAPYPQTQHAASVVVDCLGGGIGDAVLSAGCVQALQRERPEDLVVLACRPGEAAWASLFLGPGQVATSRVEASVTYRPGDTYTAELSERGGLPRWERYGSACGVVWAPPTPIGVSEEARRWAEPYRGSVILAPYSAWKCRAWEPSHWRALAQDLAAAELCPVVIDDGRDGEDRRVCYPCPRFQGEPAERIAALISAARAVVANDSGMAHIGGALGVPTVAICAQFLGERIYGGYPSVRVLQAPAPCVGCHWRGEWGWHPICDRLCAALNLVQPGDVLRALQPGA